MAAKQFFAALTLAGALAAPAFAQAPKTVADIANYQGADRQKLFEDGARREGQLLIYSIGTQAEPVYNAFAAKYPFIKVATKKDAPATITRLIVEEASANTFNVDAIELITGALYQLRDAGLLQPYWSPELAAYRKDALEPGRHWAIDYESYLGLGYNTDLVSDAEAPKTYDDLLDPKWKGRMALPATSGLAQWLGVILKEKDVAYVRRLGQQQSRLYEVLPRAVANLIVSGEVALSPAIYNSHVATSREQGGHIAWRALGGVFPATDASALAARAPHPYAAMLFIDFILSVDGQKIFQKLGYSSGRTDLPATDKPAKIYYIADEPDYAANYEKWLALAVEVFGGKK